MQASSYMVIQVSYISHNCILQVLYTAIFQCPCKNPILCDCPVFTSIAQCTSNIVPPIASVQVYKFDNALPSHRCLHITHIYNNHVTRLHMPAGSNVML